MMETIKCLIVDDEELARKLVENYIERIPQGYELDIVDYLLKPFRFERFLQAVNKAGKMLKTESAATKVTTNSPANPESETKDYILVKSEFKVFRIFYKDILYIESMKEYVAYHTAEGRTLSLGSLKKLQTELPTKQFIRIHKSYIANIDRIAALEGNMVHVGEKKLPIGTSYKEEVMKRVF